MTATGPPPRRRAGPARTGAAVLTAVLALTAGLLAAAPAHGAPQPAAERTAQQADQVQVALDTLRPVVAHPGDDLRVTGRVVNTTGSTMTDVSVQIRRSSAPVTTRKQVSRVPVTDLEPPDGVPDDVPLPGTRVTVSASLGPGQTAPFALRVPIDRLGLPGPGTYVLAFEVLGRQQGVDEFDTPLAVLRTFLPWYPQRDDIAPVDLVWLWPLSDWPARAPDGTLVTDRTPIELSAGGRLDALVRIGRRQQQIVSWVSDPALLQTAAAMSTGYQVRVADRVVPGDREQQARRWLDQVAEIASTTGVHTTPYADIDAAAVTRAGMSNDVVRAVTSASQVTRQAIGSQPSGAVYWAPFGRMDRASLDVLASAGLDTVVLSAEALPASAAQALSVVSIPTTLGSVRAVLTDTDLSALVSDSYRTAGDVLLARQAFLAHTALLAQTIAPTGDRSVVVGPTDMRWTPTASLLAALLKATRTAPWLAPRTLRSLLDQPSPPIARKRGAYGPKARDAELSPAYLARVDRQSHDLDVFTSILDDPRGVSEPFAQALLRAQSAAWRTEPRTGERLVDAVSDQLGELTASVHVLSEGTVTLSGDTGRVPVTIVNDLDRVVTVGVRLRGVPSSRLQADPLDAVEIEPGRMASVDLDVRVIGGDQLTAFVELLSPDGDPFGKPATIEVRTTAYARAASWVVAASFLAIIVFVVFGIVRRIRAARRSGPVRT